MKKFNINEIVSIFPSDKNLQHLTYCKGIIRSMLKNNNYLIYSCYNGDLIELMANELISTGKVAKSSKFDFYEIVKVTTSDFDNLSAVKGFIGGKSQNEEGEWHYSVFLIDKQEECCFNEHELESTREFAKKEDFYTGESIKVIVHPDGKSELKES